MVNSIDPSARIERLSLTVSDLERARTFYQTAIGFELITQQGAHASLGVGGHALLDLHAEPSAQPRRGYSGLYHFAILVPNRHELALAIHRLYRAGGRLGGASDHLVSEALYLSDPDGNGIEIYRDRARSEWPWRNGDLMMATEQLDLNALLAEAGEPGDQIGGLPEGTVIGHMHLHVGNIAQSEAFYREVIGFDLMVRYGGQASFLAAGGYHHHLGINTWAGIGAPPPPTGSIGLRTWTLSVSDAAALTPIIARAKASGAYRDETAQGHLVSDPSGNHLLLTCRE